MNHAQVTRLLPAMVLALASVCGTIAPLPAQEAGGLKAHPLNHVPLNVATGQLRKFLADNGLAANIIPDQQNNRLLVEGTPKVQQLSAQLLQAIDRPAAAPQPVAEEPELQAYRVAPDELQNAKTRIEAAFPPRTGVRVSADLRTGQLIVLATPAMHRQVAAALQDNAPRPMPPAAAATDVGEAPPVHDNKVTHRLKHLPWNELENGLLTLLAGRAKMTAGARGQVSQWLVQVAQGRSVAVDINRATGEVSFRGAPADVAAASKLISAMDRPVGNEIDQTRILPVRTAAADASKRAAQVVRWASQAGDNEGNPAAANEPVERRIRWGGDVVARLFQPAEGEANNAQPAPPAENNQPGDAPPNGVDGPAFGPDAANGVIGSVKIEFVEGLDIIILSGNKRDVDRVAAMIAEIDRLAQATQPEIVVYQMKHVGSEQMADLVRQVYDEVLAPRSGPVSITALVNPNSILLVGRAESVKVVQEFIVKLDQPTPPLAEFEVIRLKHMAAENAQLIVEEFLSSQQGAQAQPGIAAGGQGQLRPGLGTRAKVVADFRTNSIVVFASPRDLVEVRKMIERLDVAEIKATNKVKIFKLKNSLAEELAPVLESTILGEAAATQGVVVPGGGQTGTGQRSRQLDLGPNLRSGILADVTISPDARSNSLVVTAPAESMPLIEALIEELDALPTPEAVVKVFTIVNGDATTLADMLREMFGITQAGGGGFGGGTQGQVPSQTATGAGDSSLVNMRFSVDARSNSIIASGTSGDLEVVEAVLLRLDDVSTRKREWTVYQLNNSPAQSVADAISQMLADERTNIVQTETQAQLTPPLEIVGREVIVIPEAISNSLLISATPQYYDRVMSMVEQLDRRPPMVRIDVLIAEVFLDDLKEVGFQFGLQDSLLFDRGIGTQTGMVDPVGFPFNNVPLGNNTAVNPSAIGTQGLSSFGLGRISPTAGVGGLVFSASSESVNVLIRALQDRGKVQILSRPQITTMDNIPGAVLVGQIVSRLQGTTQNAATTSTDIEDIEVGLLLDITPRVAPDGLVTMAVNVQNRSLDESDGVDIPDGAGGTVFSPNINTTEAETTVAARTGQTIVMSGLIVKNRAIRRRGIPVVSDLPFVGPFFRFDIDADSRSELLIIMTPTIIEDDQDIEWLKQSESERMNWCLADVIDIYGDHGLVGMNQGIWNHQDTPVIFPHETPALENVETPTEATDELRLPPPAIPPAPTAPVPVEPSRSSQFQAPAGLPNGPPPADGPELQPANELVQPAGYYPQWNDWQNQRNAPSSRYGQPR